MKWSTILALGVGVLLVGFGRSAPEEAAAKLLPIPDRLVVLTIDDCNKSDRAFVAGVVKEHGFGATFFVTEGLGFLKSKERYTSWEEIAELHGMGFEIGNHTRSHPSLPRLSKQMVDAEITLIEQRCAEFKIPKPVTFCYPGFAHNLTARYVDPGKGPEDPYGPIKEREKGRE